MTIWVERVYDEPRHRRARRILVDRLWPRGLTKAQARVGLWMRDIAPSDDLRKWFAHDPQRWEEFKSRYSRELETKGDLVEELLEAARQGPIVLLYGAHDTEHNQAVALKEFLEHLPVPA